jgi:hypothetical protein
MYGAVPIAPATGLGTKLSLQKSTRLPKCSMRNLLNLLRYRE